MSNHTPGPWSHDGNGVVFGPPTNEWGVWSEVCVVRPGDDDEGLDDQEIADATLIACAPELLVQLTAAANYIDQLGGDSKRYRSTIAKATRSAK